ncbi:MAG: hypothetical protein V1837_02265 [Candidatus Woesearchaeota archaeon]
MQLLLVAFKYKKKQNISKAVAEALNFPRDILYDHHDIGPLIAIIKRTNPEFVLGMGQSKRGKLIRIERKAKDILVSKGKVISKGKQKLSSTWKLPMVKGTRICYHGGSHLCNYTFFRLLQEFEKRPRIAFLHIPKTLSKEKATAIVMRILAEA